MNLYYPNTTATHPFARLSSFPALPPTTLEKRRSKLFLGRRSNSIRQKLSCTCIAASYESGSGRGDGGSDVSEECGECVEVIVVGSRKDALLDFCSASPLLSPLLRFWNVLGQDSEQVQLQQRFTSKDSTPRTVEDFLARHSSSKAVILVASAAYGSDHTRAIKVLSNVKCGNGLVVGIILKPFSFEGKRRQDEVKDLVGKLQKQANFCIVLDTDMLLENDLVTLDEASRTTNNAVLMAINAISILSSEKHMKFLNAKDDSIREIHFPEFRKIFDSYSEARIGFGAGYNVKTSLLRAMNDCPFLGVDIKELDGVILCVIASSGSVECDEVNNISHTVRAITKCNGEIIVSIVNEPYHEANTIVATIIVFGYTRKQLAPAPRNGILSSLGQHFPFIFNIFKKQDQQLDNLEKVILSESSHVSNEISPPGIEDMPETYSLDGTANDTFVIPGKNQNSSGDTEEEFFPSRNDYGSREKEEELLDTKFSSLPNEFNSEGNHILKRELFARGNDGPAHSTESIYGSNFTDAAALVDCVSIFRLPVGVKNSEKLEESPVFLNTKRGAAWRVEGDEKTGQVVSWSGSTDIDFNKNASLFNKGNNINNSKKQGGLSVRAASMLESERDSEKKWSRVLEIRYRGGIYKGRSQGGLPEGKGRLLFGDGSIYEGMWRYGKRSGLGTFYFNNGDVFQGSWRDDVMHGKGWIYFLTGDRWFANFWKGKADGEGRFYSKYGDVFFGHFKEGWRHGRFLRINVDGTRAEEIWKEGVRVSEKQLDPDHEDG